MLTFVERDVALLGKAASQIASSNTQSLNLNTLDGYVVSIVDDRLVMTNMTGKKFFRTIAKEAVFKCDGTACAMEQLASGLRIRVTMDPDDRYTAIGIESLNKHTEFARAVGSRG